MQLTGRKAVVAVAGFFLAGLLIGWLAVGWWLWPVEFYDADPFDLRESFKIHYITMVADSYTLNNNLELARERFEGWPDEELGAILSDLNMQYMREGRGADAQRISTLTTNLGIVMPAASPSSSAPEQAAEGKSVWGTIFAVGGIALAAVFVIAGGALGWSYLQKQRGATLEMPSAGITRAAAAPKPQQKAAASASNGLGTFVTTYNLGDDGYDDCFPIETIDGEFLGECGVGISEIIGDGEPNLVTAFEIWLFDKSDIRTVTKVVMSEYAYADDDLRDRLAPKGEIVLAQPGKVVSLETASLKVQAEIEEMAYGAGEGPEQSHFTKLTVELKVVEKQAVGQEMSV